MALGRSNVEWTGMGGVVLALNQLPLTAGSQIGRKALREGAKPVKPAVKARFIKHRRRRKGEVRGKRQGSRPRNRTGALQQSIITTRVKTLSRKKILWIGTGSSMGITGQKVPRQRRFTKKVRERIGDRRIVPSNYAHLVEFGHRVAAPGTRLAGNTFRRFGKKNNKPRYVKRRPELPTGPSLGHVSARPFLRPAHRQTQDKSLRITQRVMKEETLRKIVNWNGKGRGKKFTPLQLARAFKANTKL